MKLDNVEERDLREFMGLPKDVPLTLETLFKDGIAKLEPSHSIPIGEPRMSEWLKVEFIYHGDGWHLDCYIRMSDKKDYAGAGCGLHWRPYENITLALSRALLQAIKIRSNDGKQATQ